MCFISPNLLAIDTGCNLRTAFMLKNRSLYPRTMIRNNIVVPSVMLCKPVGGIGTCYGFEEACLGVGLSPMETDQVNLARTILHSAVYLAFCVSVRIINIIY